MGAAQQILASLGGAGGGGGGPAFINSTRNGIGATNDDDKVLLVLVAPGGSAVSAPTGWTRDYNTTEANGYPVALYSSDYAAGNAAANSTNFPAGGNGYFFTLVYRGSGPLSVLQVGTLTDVAASNANMSVSALGSATGASSALIGFTSSRDPGDASVSSGEGMTNRYDQLETFFSVKAWEQTGVQSGARNFTRAFTVFNFIGLLVEIG